MNTTPWVIPQAEHYSDAFHVTQSSGAALPANTLSIFTMLTVPTNYRRAILTHLQIAVDPLGSFPFLGCTGYLYVNDLVALNYDNIVGPLGINSDFWPIIPVFANAADVVKIGFRTPASTPFVSFGIAGFYEK